MMKSFIRIGVRFCTILYPVSYPGNYLALLFCKTSRGLVKDLIEVRQADSKILSFIRKMITPTFNPCS
jgi:Flp pilus assembly CpaF family ATPase